VTCAIDRLLWQANMTIERAVSEHLRRKDLRSQPHGQ
jgi:hypothetical protein